MLIEFCCTLYVACFLVSDGHVLRTDVINYRSKILKNKLGRMLGDGCQLILKIPIQ